MMSSFGIFRRFVMSLFHNAVARLLAISTLATLGLVTAAEAQMYSPGQQGQGGGMMGGGWGWGMGNGGYGMGGFGGIGLLVIALVVLGIAVMAFRRRTP
jgi:hypothetical protein